MVDRLEPGTWVTLVTAVHSVDSRYIVRSSPNSRSVNTSFKSYDRRAVVARTGIRSRGLSSNDVSNSVAGPKEPDQS